MHPEEKAFQDALDANPDDHVTRLVFADWLEERDDPRAEGYRVLAVLRVRPAPTKRASRTWGRPGYVTAEYARRYEELDGWDILKSSVLPDDWHQLIPVWNERPVNFDDGWRCRETAREIEDAAAVAFGQLLPDRRAELLAGKAVTA